MELGSTFNVTETRNLFDKPLGVIIEGVLGDARTRQMFDEAGKHPEKYKNVPTAKIAVMLGYISQTGADSLLAAQAAERTLRLADKIETIINNPPSRESVKKEGFTKLGHVDATDPLFKYVGSAGDAQSVRTAQATWFTAQLIMNQELSAVVFSNAKSSKEFNPVASLRSSAVDSFKAAALIMESDGLDKAALRLNAVVASIPAVQQLGKAEYTKNLSDALSSMIYLEEFSASAMAYETGTNARYGHEYKKWREMQGILDDKPATTTTVVFSAKPEKNL